jgi:hypothetical protein
MTRFTPQYGHGHIAILDEAPAVQTAIEPVSHATGWLVGAFLVRTMSCRFAKQTKGPPHLRFGFVTRSCLIRRAAEPILWIFAGVLIKAQFQIFRQFHHLGRESDRTTI